MGIALFRMTTKHLIGVVDAEVAKICEQNKPLNRMMNQIWMNSLQRIRTQLMLNTDAASIVHQLENELMKYALSIEEFEREEIPESDPVTAVLQNWGQSLRNIFERIAEDSRFELEVNRMIQRVV